MEIKSEEPITLAEAEALLKKRKEEEMRYEQKASYEYVHKFSELSKKEAKELVEKLLDLDLVKVKKEHAVKIADLLPENKDDLRAIFAKERFSLKSDEMEQILEVVDQYR